MTNLSPVLIAAVVTMALGTIGALIYWSRQSSTFRGYRGISGDARKIASLLKGEVFRDGEDLVISGDYQGIPAIVRFSNDENTPGMHLEARVTSALHLSMNPKQLPDNNAGKLLKLNSWLEQRFVGRSKTPADADMLLGQRRTMTILARLCCSSKTVLEVTPGKLDLVEMTIPSSPAGPVTDRLADIWELEQVLRLMPGADEIKITTIPRERSSWTLRAAIASGVVMAVLCVLAATREHTQPVLAATETGDINGIVRSDAALIPMADQWQLVNPSDIDSSFAEFLGGFGQKPSSRMVVDLDGSGHNNDVVYLLANKSGQRRLVVLEDHRVIFDTCFPTIAGVARVPSTAFPKIQWDESRNIRQQQQSAGDGVLMVRNADDPHSAVMLYMQKGALQSGAPTDYRGIGLD